MMTLRDAKTRRIYDKDRADSVAWYRQLLKADATASTTRDIMRGGDASSTDNGEAIRQQRPRLRTIPGSYSSEESNMETSAAYSLSNELREESTDLSSMTPMPTTQISMLADDHEELSSISKHQANLLRQGILYEPSQEELEQITSRYALRGSADSGSDISWGSSARYHAKTSSNVFQESKHSTKHTLARSMNGFSRSSERMVPVTPILTPSLPQVKLDPINPRKDAHRHDRMTATASTAQLANRLHVPTRVVARRRSISTSQPNVHPAEITEPYMSSPGPRPLLGGSHHFSVGGEQDNLKTEQRPSPRTGTLYDYSQNTSTVVAHSQTQGSTQPGFSLVVRQPTARLPSTNDRQLHNDSLLPMQQRHKPQEDLSKPNDNVDLQSSLGTEYWGFAPSFKDRVEEALISALNRVRQRDSLDSKYRVAAKSYRKMISEDLARISSSVDNLLQYDTDTVVSDMSNARAEARGVNDDVDREGSDQETARTAASAALPQSLKLHPPPNTLHSQPLGVDTSQIILPVQQYGIVPDSELVSVHDTNSAMETMGPTRSELDFFINLGDPHGDVDSLQSVQLTPMVETEDLKINDEASQLSEYVPTTIQRRDSATITNDQGMESSTGTRLPRLVSLAHTHADTETSRYPDIEAEGQIMHYNPDDNATQTPNSKRGSVASESTAKRRTLSWLKDIFTTSDPQKVQVLNGPSEALGVARSRTAPALTTNNLEVIRAKRPALHREHTNATDALPTAYTQKSRVSHPPHTTQTFTKTIEDFENLLAEALSIAREAAERQDYRELPRLLASAADALKHDKSEVELTTSIDQASSAPELPSLLVHAGVMPESVTNSHEDSPNSASVSVLEASRPISNCAVIEKPYVVEPSYEGLQSVPIDHGLPLIADVPETPMTFGSPERHKATINQSMNGASSCTSEIPLYDNRSLMLEEEDTKLVTDVESDHVNSGVAFMPDTRHEVDITSLLPQIKENVPSATIPHPGQRVSLASLQSLSQDGVMKTTTSRKEPKPVLKGVIATCKAPPSNMDNINLVASAHVIGQRSVVPDRREVHEYIRVLSQPPLHPRNSSYGLRRRPEYANLPARERPSDLECTPTTKEVESFSLNSIQTMDGFESDDHDMLGFSNPSKSAQQDTFRRHNTPKQDSDGFELVKMNIPGKISAGSTNKKSSKYVSLKGKSHINIAHHKGFSLARHHKRAPLARDWSPFRKRFAASVICVSTAMIGILIGIYAGMVPSIQYYIADQNHTAILGNVFFYIGLAIPTFVAWPLPLLHGRKPYILASLSLAMPLLFPQGIMVQQQRSPYVATFRVGLILPRAFMGMALGLAQMNFMATLLDLFGASLMAVNPHQEVVDDFDVRRHGGGMGIWLGLWTWCYTGSIGIGFLTGCAIINTQTPAWGFYVSIIIIAFVLVLNIITPEVRRSAFRRSVVEVKRKGQTERRLGRGEVMMHRIRTGPKWWAQEVHHGILLSIDMLKQPGFLVVLTYSAWTYGQIILIIVLLGSLMSKEYRFRSPEVGFCALAIPIGGFLAIPFTKASLFSRARDHAVRRDSATFEKQFTWTSHLVRRSIFTFVLPVVGLAYTLSSEGPPTPFILPIIFAGLLSFLSNLAIAECNGLIMDTFDTSDLHPGMTGRSRKSTESGDEGKRTNYSSFPRVASAFALCQGFGFLVAAVATGIGGVAQRHLGQRAATAVMEAFLLVFTVLLLGVLVRWKEVQIIPTAKTGDMEKWEKARRESLNRSETRARTWNSAKVALGPNTPSQAPVEEEEPWRPIIIGNPSGKTRRMNILEMGRLSRWSEIRHENRLIDAGSLEEQHPERYIVQRVVSRIEGHNAAVDEEPKAVTRISSKRGSKRNRGQPLLAPDSTPTGEMEPDEDGDVLPPLVDTLKPNSREPLRGGSKTDGR